MDPHRDFVATGQLAPAARVVPPAGVEPATPALGNDCSGAVSVGGQELTTVPPRPPADSPAVEQRGGATRRDAGGLDGEKHDIEVVARAWPHLPRELKLAILALVRAACSANG